jgi:hypothetical protein
MFYSNPFRPNLNQQGVILQDIQRANDSFYSLSQTYVNGDVVSGKVLLAATADNAYNANHASSADNAYNANHASSADSATNANHATSADSATNANHATSADSATNANHATSADSATNANHASSADSATNANHASSADSATNANNASSADSATNANHASTSDVSTYTDKMLITTSTSYNLGQYDGLKLYSNTPSLVIQNQWGVNDYSDKGIFEVDLTLYGSAGFIFFWAPNNVNYSNTNFKQQYTQIYLANAPVSYANNSSYNGFGITTSYLTGSSIKAFIKMRVCCNTDHKYVQYQANAYSLSANTYAQEIGHIFWNDSTSWDTVGGMYLTDSSYNLISLGYISGVIRRVL